MEQNNSEIDNSKYEDISEDNKEEWDDNSNRNGKKWEDGGLIELDDKKILVTDDLARNKNDYDKDDHDNVNEFQADIKRIDKEEKPVRRKMKADVTHNTASEIMPQVKI